MPRPPYDGPAAVLWDMDGTLVDTEPFWVAAEHEIVAEHGGTWTEQDSLALVGHDLRWAAAYLQEHGGVRLGVPEIVEALLDRVVHRVREEVPWRPGARDLLADLRRHGVPTALVTMSWERLVTPVVRALPHGSFDAVVSGDVVDHGKPHPQPYLHAARLLGVAPEQCLAIEDSDTGARSAVAAGCTVLVVPHHVRPGPGPGRVFRDGLAGADAAELAALWRARTGPARS